VAASICQLLEVALKSPSKIAIQRGGWRDRGCGKEPSLQRPCPCPVDTLVSMIVSQVLAFTAIAFRTLPTTSTIPEKNVPSAVTAGAEPTLHHRLRNGAKKSNLTVLAQIHSSDGLAFSLGVVGK
jgi:hypothetical protein